MFFGKIELAMDFQTVRTHLMKKTVNHVKDRGRRERYPGTHFWGSDGYRVAARKKFWVPMGTGYQPEKKFGYRVPTKFQFMPTPVSIINIITSLIYNIKIIMRIMRFKHMASGLRKHFKYCWTKDFLFSCEDVISIHASLIFVQ